jgi:exodeoxyribonuclease VII small subunit
VASKDIHQLSYEQAVSELNAIIEEFDSGNVSVDLLAEKFERAVEILQELSQRINNAKMQIQELSPKVEEILKKEGAEQNISPVRSNKKNNNEPQLIDEDLFEEMEDEDTEYDFDEEPF